MRGIAAEYELVTARDLPEALALLDSSADSSGAWRPIAGGTDLMVLFNAGKLTWHRLVSIRDLDELREIEIQSENIIIGAAVTYSQIRHHPVLQTEFPLLCQAASWTGAVANQNRGTLGGNIANASPAADSPPMLLVYDAELELISRAATRWLPYSEFHLGYKLMQLRREELIRKIRLPRRIGKITQYARKVGTRKAQAISKVCLAVTVARSGRVLHQVRIAVGSVAPVPLRCFDTEKVLEGSALSAAVIARAKEGIAAEIQPITDIRSTQQYRTQVTVNLLGEFLESIA